MLNACTSCGARLQPDAAQCDLCGILLSDAPDEVAPETFEEQSVAPFEDQAQPARPPADGAVYCSACGARSAPEGRFCWRCGAALAIAAPRVLPPAGTALPASEAPAPAAPSAHAARHGLLLVVAGAVLVGLLFAITQISGRVNPLRPPGQVAQAAPAVPELPADIATRVSLLEEQIAQSRDEQRIALRQELVDVLIGAGAFLRAAEVQEALAREVQTVEAWAEAGSFFLAHVLRADAPDAAAARRSVAAFEEALALRPGDLDIMTDLATAYRYSPDDPMRAVDLVQQVLAENPDHARARFNFALMLAEIGRTEQAREHLEAVIANEDADPFVRDRAREMLETIRQAES